MKIYQDMSVERDCWLIRVGWNCGIIFLCVTCFTRIGVLFNSNSLQIQLLGCIGGALLLVPVFKPSWLKKVIFCFALSFPLYGSLPYSSHAFLFELFVSVLSLTLLLTMIKEKSFCRGKGPLQFLLFAYFLLACASLLLLPIQVVAWKMLLWDWEVFWNAVFFLTPEQPLYSVNAVNRLALFILFALLLASRCGGKELFRTFFIGLLAGAFWASLIGIAEYYNFFDLSWFRVVADRGTRLQSVFANPGWFAEYLAVTIPYVLLGFLSQKLKIIQKICLFGVLVVCEIAIILTYSRTGWFIYPLVLFVCWFFFYIATQVESGRLSWKQITRIFLKVIISVPLTLLLSYVLIFYVFDLNNTAITHDSEKFENRISHMTNPALRKVIWSESLEIVKVKPFFGLGYESFKFQNSILKKTQLHWDTPHSFYLQLLVSGGIIGTTLWGLLVLTSCLLLVFDLIKNKAYFNIAVILSIVAFHLYGLAQSMQYIPLIWFLIFLNFGYAMTINEKVLPLWFQKMKSKFISGVMLIVFLGLIVYISDFESRKLANEEQLKIYSVDQNQKNYLGFYQAEHWGDKGIYRWTGSSAIIKLPAAEKFQFTFVCAAPDLSVKPLILYVSHKGKQIDKITFHRAESITKQYVIPSALSAQKNLHFSVSRTWNLKKLGGAPDSRNLGVAISELKVLDKMLIN